MNLRCECNMSLSASWCVSSSSDDNNQCIVIRIDHRKPLHQVNESELSRMTFMWLLRILKWAHSMLKSTIYRSAGDQWWWWWWCGWSRYRKYSSTRTHVRLKRNNRHNKPDLSHFDQLSLHDLFTINRMTVRMCVFYCIMLQNLLLIGVNMMKRIPRDMCLTQICRAQILDKEKKFA